MATDQRSLLISTYTNAEFRTWGQAIAAQLAACGLIKTNDTGQIDWTAVTKPTAGNKAGYEIYRFNDALQATKPIFLRLDYGAATNAVAGPGLWLTVGTSVNGAGVIGGQMFAERQIHSQSSTSGDGESYASGSQTGPTAGRVALLTNLSSQSYIYGMGFVIDRTRDATGAATDDGFIVWASSYYNSTGYRVIPHVGVIPALLGSANANSMEGQISKNGLEVALSPWMACLGKALCSLAAVTYVNADIGSGVAIQAGHLGSTRTLMPIGSRIQDNGLTLPSTSGRAIAMLWE